MLRIRVIGGFEISGPDGRIAFPSAKLSAFLAVLAVSARPVRREELTALLWGSHFDEQARANFRQALTRIRKIIGAESLASDDQFVHLSDEAVSVDVRDFEALRARTTQASLSEAAGLLEGDLLAGIDLQEPAWEEWLSTARRRLADAACETLVRLGGMELAAGLPGQALAHAEACIARDIFREDAHRLALRALAAQGRRAEALRHYGSLAERLKQELGIQPADETQALYKELRHEAGRQAEPSAAAATPQRRPSIAVLPFANLGGGDEQDYFIDGVVDEIITALSRFHWLFVIARNSSFTYKGRPVDVKQVGRELGVRYVLEGSVRCAGNRLRISGQLVDATTGGALWADRMEGDITDVFELQDLVTAQVVTAIAPKLEQAEIERSRLKPTASLDAYDYYLRGQAEVLKWTRGGNRLALAAYMRAFELDPAYSSAYAMAARCYSQAKAQGWISDPAAEKAEVRRLAHLAIEHGPDDPVALSASGMARAFVDCDLDGGGALIDRALQLNPNLATAWMFGGWVKAWMGDADEAIERVTRAMQLSPRDPSLSNMRRAIAFSYFVAGRYAEAIAVSEQATPLPQNLIFGLATIAASAALLGDFDKARAAVARLHQEDAGLSLATLHDRFPLKRPEDFGRWEDALRKAGLPSAA
jgi:TolB-like protein